MSATTIDTMLWNIQWELMNQIGCDAAERAMSPPNWYINTGRAPTEFLRKLHNVRPVLVARDLAKGGSYDAAIKRVCKRIGFTIAE